MDPSSQRHTGPFIAGIGLTHLSVYEQRPAPDGLSSGCAHVHALTDEAYYVVAGEGAIELHDAERGFRSVPLARGDFVQFPPGTLHRSVSTPAWVLCTRRRSGLRTVSPIELTTGDVH